MHNMLVSRRGHSLDSAGMQTDTHKYTGRAYFFREGGKFSTRCLLQNLGRTTLQSPQISYRKRVEHKQVCCIMLILSSPALQKSWQENLLIRDSKVVLSYC